MCVLYLMPNYFDTWKAQISVRYLDLRIRDQNKTSMIV
jgi:hypothetical protein